MEYTLSSFIMTDLGNDYCGMLEVGELREHAKSTIRQIVINDFDGEIWELVEDEENESELDFYEVVDEVVESVISLGEYYFENNQNG
jgi:hypothetical protein